MILRVNFPELKTLGSSDMICGEREYEFKCYDMTDARTDHTSRWYDNELCKSNQPFKCPIEAASD